MHRIKGKISKICRANSKIDDLELYENPILDYDYLKPENLTQPLTAFNNEISVEDLNKIMDELGIKIDPSPLKPMPIPYVMAKINSI